PSGPTSRGGAALSGVEEAAPATPALLARALARAARPAAALRQTDGRVRTRAVRDRRARALPDRVRSGRRGMSSALGFLRGDHRAGHGWHRPRDAHVLRGPPRRALPL